MICICMQMILYIWDKAASLGDFLARVDQRSVMLQSRGKPMGFRVALFTRGNLWETPFLECSFIVFGMMSIWKKV